MFSAADWLSGMAMTPALAMLKPTMPMTTAMPREMTTQTVLAAMEPMIILFMGVIIGVLVVSVIMPIGTMYSGLDNL